MVDSLQQAYAADGFGITVYPANTGLGPKLFQKLQHMFVQLLSVRPEVHDWTVLLEYPLYRLRRRIDIVILAGSLVVVVECKVGAEAFTAEDRRQVEEYALDLRDFHAESYRRTIVPVSWSTDTRSPSGGTVCSAITRTGTVEDVIDVGAEGLQGLLVHPSLTDDWRYEARW